MVEVHLTCPMCNCKFGIKDESLVYEDMEGSTCDCPNPKCKALLVITCEGVKNFHEWMNKNDNRWDKEGKNTGYIDVLH